ncbi:nuclease-related domain-containing protein [Idiomarina sp. HP20-50]|uniref:nuclease-related domain-containing protein n=1 Tax=Idiomarina sp. HP20-50 TaxID=3070813 RepID=UPI00294AABA1|nr:nuclease-related domain-containing protein [Idiomarina sp. HP20-50]MDV6315748.1 nuclease-related domain-containing protein [Idiomarina sp. HP20-50]
MADTQYITTNRLSQEVNQTRLWVAIIGAPVAGFFMYQLPNLWWIIGLIYLFAIIGAASTKRSGARGELKTLKLLKKLPDNYVLFNQVDVPNPRAKRGFTELDLIVVGPNGVFVVEVKNNNSKVTGDEQVAHWTAHKVGRKGGRYTAKVRNPIKQLKKQVHVLAEHLKRNRASTWIDGVVFFSHRGARVKLTSPPSVPVLERKGLVEYILSYTPKRAPSNIETVVQQLVALKQAIN